MYCGTDFLEFLPRMNVLPSRRQGTHQGKGAATGDTNNDPYAYLGHTNGGPSAKFAFSEGSHGTIDAAATTDAAAAMGGRAGLKPDLAGTAPYWASDLPNDMPQKQALLKGEDKLNDIPPELRKSFRQVCVCVCARARVHSQFRSISLNPGV
jgi:hypothetical protein